MLLSTATQRHSRRPPPTHHPLAQCATAEGRFGLGFCGPILSLVGVFWWLAYGAAATSAALAAGSWDSSLTSYRTAVVALSWALMCTFITAFFLSAAAASAAARARAKLDATLAGTAHPGAASAVRIDPALAIKLKRFNQPMASPPVSPSKSSIRSFGSSACGEHGVVACIFLLWWC